MQNAIDDLLRLNGCDDVIPPHHHHIANAVHPTGVAPVAVGGASSSTHHYEPVTGSGGVAAGASTPSLPQQEDFTGVIVGVVDEQQLLTASAFTISG